MMTIKLEQVIPSIVEFSLPRFSPEDKGFIIALDVRDDDYTRDIGTATSIIFLFRRPNNYTQVLYRYAFDNGLISWNDMKNNYTYFSHGSYHDSCWRTDGMRILSTHMKNVNDIFEKHPKDISQTVMMSAFSPMGYVKIDDMIEHKSDNKFNRPIGYDVKLNNWEE